MKIGSLTIEFGTKKRPAAPESKEIDAGAVEQKSGSWSSLWPMAMEWLIFKNKRLTKPFLESSNVYKAISAIASNIPQAEIAFYKEGTNEEVEDKALSDLFYRPNPYESWHDFIESVAGHFAASGEAFIIKEQSLGQAVGTRRLPGQLWTDAATKFETIIDKRTGLLTGWKYNNRTLKPEEVIHIKTFNLYDRFRGACPLDVMDGEIQLDYKSLQYNARFLDNDATPSFILSTDKNLTDDQRKRLTEWAEKRNKGIENAGKMTIFDNGMKPEVLAKSHKDMEFSEQRNFAREEILGAWKTPKALFNITEALNYATFTGQMKIFWLYTLVPIMRKIEEGINYGLVEAYNPNIYFAFKLDNIPAFQEDFASKVTTAKTLFDMGFTGNEINQKLNLGFEEADWREYWWIGFGQVPADAAAATATPDATVDPNADPAAKGAPPVADKRDGLFALKTWRSFVAKQAPIETRFHAKVKRYFLDLRKTTLSAVYQGGKSVDAMVNWGGKDEELKKLTLPMYRKAIQDGVEVGKELVGKKSVIDDVLNQKVESMVSVAADKIKGINNTIKKQLGSTLDLGITAGESIEQLADRVREVFNVAERRSFVIARTETAGAVNAGTNLYYTEVGIEKKRWVTAGDELVRESHRKIDGETQYPEDRFSNGLAYPGDQESGDAGEVVNCRCTISPVL